MEGFLFLHHTALSGSICPDCLPEFQVDGKATENQTPFLGNGTPLQYSCLENPMDGGAWQAAVHVVAKSQTRLSDFTFTPWRRKWQPIPVFLPGESQGRGSLVGCHLWGRTESDTTEATQQQQHRIPGGSEVKASACNVGDLGSIPGLGRSPGEGTGNPLQYSCLENPMDGEAQWATIHEVAKSPT